MLGRISEPTDLLESGLLIDGEWRRASAGGTMDHVNPATGKPQKTFAIASLGEVDDAVAAARRALKGWRHWKPDARRDVLLRLADLVADYTTEIGLIWAQESGNIASDYVGRWVEDWTRYYAGWADKLTGESIEAYPFTGIDFTVPEPVGVVAHFVSWNGPIGYCGMGSVPALAAGCTVVIKTPELAPFSPVTFGRLCLEAGVPSGVVNVVTGGPDAARALASHPGVDKIAFTGGTAVASEIQAAASPTLTPMVTELGGKSANIIFADADIEAAIPEAARFTNNAGQGCSMPMRLLVEEPVYERVMRGVIERAAAVIPGDPLDSNATMGPVISAAALDRIMGIIDRARVGDAGRLVLGGHRLGGDLAEGYFVAPTIFVDVDNRSEIAQEEVFGPVLCMIPFRGEDEAIAIANDTKYGLAAYAHTRDMARARRLVRDLEAGNVFINHTGPGPLSPASPFGGVKQSGVGRQGSWLGIAEFLQFKNVYLNI